MRNCTGCGEPIHPKRLEIMPNTTRCVSCSTVQKKGAVTIMKGTGDHTWIETIHLEHEDYKAYMEAENKLRKNGATLLETPETTSNIPFGFSETKLDKDPDA
jgi:uncharacterized radical SAM superfamily Fe-S cluster-containing enzyme